MKPSSYTLYIILSCSSYDLTINNLWDDISVHISHTHIWAVLKKKAITKPEKNGGGSIHTLVCLRGLEKNMVSTPPGMRDGGEIRKKISLTDVRKISGIKHVKKKKKKKQKKKKKSYCEREIWLLVFSVLTRWLAGVRISHYWSTSKHKLEKWFIISGEGVRTYITKQTDQKELNQFSSLCFGWYLGVDHCTTQV